MRKRLALFSLTGIVFLVVAIGAYNLPPVHNVLAWRLENLVVQVRYALNPPGEVVFVPQGGGMPAEGQRTVEAIVQATMQSVHATASAAAQNLTSPAVTVQPPAAATIEATQEAPAPAQPPPATATPTVPPTPIPDKVILTGAVHEYQQMNNCGPATLAMALSFWGWQGDQATTRAVLRPNFKDYDDKNVMPAEMEAFVEAQPGLKAVVRVGGDVDLLKRLVAAGFPVIIEKGFQPPKEDWMGHFELVTGYDDARQKFITQDSYIMADFPLPYAEIESAWWRDFNNVYLVIYPAEREAEVQAVLGPQWDTAYNYQYAAQKAEAELTTLSGRDLYFAWYNLGTNRLALGDAAGAAQAYDQAFGIYPAIPAQDRPWRMLWYQTGPYQAYFETGRYQDVIALGNTTLNLASKPVLEESFYWLGRAREATGDLEKAVYDYQQAAAINPDSTPARQELARLGVASP